MKKKDVILDIVLLCAALARAFLTYLDNKDREERLKGLEKRLNATEDWLSAVLDMRLYRVESEMALKN